MSEEEQSHLDFEQKYVHDFYSVKSQKFSNTRVKPWPFTLAFMNKYSSSNSLILDSGCGNGRQFIHQNTVGVDFSAGLLAEARRKFSIGLVKENVHDLCFKDKAFDIVLSVAVIHHLSTHERRLKCLLEMKRVLKDEGVCLIYVWHVDASSKRKFTRLQNSEFLVSWKGEVDLMRYYFLFDEKTLKDLCVEAGFDIVDLKREEESVYVVVKKKKD